MRRNDPSFDGILQEATDWLLKDFIRWNEAQERLKEQGRPNNHYDVEDLLRMRSAFQAIAERFVLEDVDYSDWQWLETSWAGTDGNTGEEAYTIDFMATDPREVGWGILSFYVTRNKHCWIAAPLATNLQANCIQVAIDWLSQSEA